MRWFRLAGFVAASVIGLGVTYIAVMYDVPRWFVAISGLMFAIGIFATGTLGAFLWVTITEDVRPSLRFRRPVVPIAISHNEAGMIGERRFRQHPVRFWGGLALNSRFFVGFMVFSPPEYLHLFDAQPSPASTPTPELI